MKTKKIMLMALFVGALSVTSCSDSNDDQDSLDDCKTCTTSEYCDNGDGTVTVTSNGQEETVDLQGLTFAAFIETVKIALPGTTCN